MKNIILLIAMAFIWSCKAQQTTVNITTLDYRNDNSNKYFKDIDGLYDPFLGTWEYTTGTTTFRVELVKNKIISTTKVNYAEDKIEGKFYLIENAGTPSEIITCQSESHTPRWGFTPESVIYISSYDGLEAHGGIYDNCANYVLSSRLDMTIIDPNATTLTANWHVYRKGLGKSGFTYSIPTDVVLTKQ